MTLLSQVVRVSVYHVSHAASTLKQGKGSASLMDGAMYCFGSVASQLEEEKVEQMCGEIMKSLLKDCVVPQLQSQVPHIRGRA